MSKLEKNLKKYIKDKPQSCFKDFLADKLKDNDFARGFEKEKIKLKIALEVYRQRQQAKVSPSKLAKLSGVSQDNIMQIENGKRTPSFNTLDKIAVALGKELDVSFC